MVLMKMLMKMKPPTMRGTLVMTMASISPSRREVSPAESLRRRAKVLLPWFHLETAAAGPESLLLIFFLGQMASYRGRIVRQWTSVGPTSPGWRDPGGGARPLPCGPMEAPLRYFFLPVFFIYSKINLQNFTSFWALENCYLCCSFFRSKFQLPVISLFWCILHFKREKALELHHKMKYNFKTR